MEFKTKGKAHGLGRRGSLLPHKTNLGTLILLCFADAAFFTNCRWVAPPCGASLRHRFPAAFAHLTSLRHVLVVLTVFQAFSLLYLSCDLWSVISDVTTLVILVFLNSNYFLIKVCTFKRLQYGVDITHLCTRKPKKKKKNHDSLYCKIAFLWWCGPKPPRAACFQ